MFQLDAHPSGRHFLQIPGPDQRAGPRAARDRPADDRSSRARVRAADARDPRRPEGRLPDDGPIVIYPASGTGAWEAALVNTLSPGDRVLMFETGHFATLWRAMAEKLGLVVDFVPGDWRSGVDPALVEAKLAEDRRAHDQGGAGRPQRDVDRRHVPHRRESAQAIDRAGHPALFMVDTISSLASIDYRHDEWGVDVTVGGLAEGPDAAAGAVVQRGQRQGARREQAGAAAALVLALGRDDRDEPAGLFPVTPATNLLYGLHEALAMLREEGLPTCSRATQRHAEATRRAVRAWGLEVLCRNPAEYSGSLTAVMMPDGHDADAFRREVLARYDLSLGTGLGKLAGRVFRIGHLGFFNDLMLCGTLCGVEMGLAVREVPHKKNGVAEALAYLQESGKRGDDRAATRRMIRRSNRSDALTAQQCDNEAGSEIASPHDEWRTRSALKEDRQMNNFAEERARWRSRWRACRPSRGSPPSPSRSSSPPAPAARPTRWRA